MASSSDSKSKHDNFIYVCFRDYDQARRAYLNALKYNPSHEQVMRDLSSLQIFLRDYQGFEETRRNLLIHSPAGVQNWVTLAGAQYLNKNYEGAFNSMQTLFKFYENDTKILKRHEASEAVLFTCRILEKIGQTKEAIDFLTKHDKLVVDSVKKTEYYGYFNEQSGEKEKALEKYEHLLQLNSANLDTYKLIFRAKGINLPKHSERLSQAD
jgi:tetratricopeptide (TPR) repeat protein